MLCPPSKNERKPGEKIKTDKRDAKKLAKLFKDGDITPVRIPQELAVREGFPPQCNLRDSSSYSVRI